MANVTAAAAAAADGGRNGGGSGGGGGPTVPAAGHSRQQCPCHFPEPRERSEVNLPGGGDILWPLLARAKGERIEEKEDEGKDGREAEEKGPGLNRGGEGEERREAEEEGPGAN